MHRMFSKIVKYLITPVRSYMYVHNIQEHHVQYACIMFEDRKEGFCLFFEDVKWEQQLFLVYTTKTVPNNIQVMSSRFFTVPVLSQMHKGYFILMVIAID